MCSPLTPSKRRRLILILLASSTRSVWTPGMKWCTAFSLRFLWVGIKLWTRASGCMNTLRKSVQHLSANRCATTVSFVHTEHVDNSVRLSQHESVPGTRSNDFLTHWSKPACLFTLSLVFTPPSLLPPPPLPQRDLGWEFDPLRPVVGVSRHGFGAFALHCFMSHHWLGERRRNQFSGLVTLRIGLQCGESSWPLSVRLTLSLNGGAVRDRGCGCPLFVNLWWRQV